MATTASRGPIEPEKNWLLFASHGAVLFYVAGNPDATLREIAHDLGMASRTVSLIVSDLIEGNYMTVTRAGRRNVYSVNTLAHFRHPFLSHVRIADLLELVLTNTRA